MSDMPMIKITEGLFSAGRAGLIERQHEQRGHVAPVGNSPMQPESSQSVPYANRHRR